MTMTVGEIVTIDMSGDVHEAKVRVRAAFMTVPLLPELDVRCGDLIIIESGIGIAKITELPGDDPCY